MLSRFTGKVVKRNGVKESEIRPEALFARYLELRGILIRILNKP